MKITVSAPSVPTVDTSRPGLYSAKLGATSLTMWAIRNTRGQWTYFGSPDVDEGQSLPCHLDGPLVGTITYHGPVKNISITT